MNYAIIAAGEGSRLAKEGVRMPKPLVNIHGERLIDRLIRVFMANGAEQIAVICNNLRPEVEQHLARLRQQGLHGMTLPLHYIVQTTPSSMHSFYALSQTMPRAPFVLTTVDTLFREDEFRDYIDVFRQQLAAGYDGVMGVTDYVDDERPLYVGTDADMNVTGFFDANTAHFQYISGGIYGLTADAFQTLHGCMQRGESRMRNFQRALIADGKRLKAHAFSKVMDIDHASDITKAEDFLK